MNNLNVKMLENCELSQINGGSFGYDAGAVLGFIGRSIGPLGLPYAIAVWNIQYSK
jgi:hypothetical protein